MLLNFTFCKYPIHKVFKWIEPTLAFKKVKKLIFDKRLSKYRIFARIEFLKFKNLEPYTDKKRNTL